MPKLRHRGQVPHCSTALTGGHSAQKHGGHSGKVGQVTSQMQA